MDALGANVLVYAAPSPALSWVLVASTRFPFPVGRDGVFTYFYLRCVPAGARFPLRVWRLPQSGVAGVAQGQIRSMPRRLSQTALA